MTLAPGAGPVALVGPNGAGKTNILEAISLLSPGRGFRRARVDEMARTPEQLGWKIAAEFSQYGLPHTVETWAGQSGPRQVRIDGKATSQLALGALVRVVWLVPTMDRLWLEGAEGRRRFLDRMALSLFPEHAKAALAYEKAMRERNRLLKDGILDDAWYRVLEAQMAAAGARLVENRQRTLARLEDAQREAKTAFPRAGLRLLWPDEGGPIASESDLQGALADNRQRDRAAGRTLIGPHRADMEAVYLAKETPARKCSTGEQKALLISLTLANARALAQDTGHAPILLLDEVAAHLDASRRRALYDEICVLGAQAWMTGTEAHLFDALERRARMLAVQDGEDGSIVAPLIGE